MVDFVRLMEASARPMVRLWALFEGDQLSLTERRQYGEP